MGATIKQKKIYQSATSEASPVITFDAPTTAGNFLVAIVSMTNNTLGAAISVPSGWTMVTYGNAPGAVDGVMDVYVFIKANAPSTPSLTITAGRPCIWAGALYEIAGAPTTAVVSTDVQGLSAFYSGLTSVAEAVCPAGYPTKIVANGGIVFTGAASSVNYAPVGSPKYGETEVLDVSGAGGAGYASIFAYKELAPAPGAFTSGFTMNNGGYASFTGVVIAGAAPPAGKHSIFYGSD